MFLQKSNINIACESLKKDGLNNLGINYLDIYNENLKSVFLLIWKLIQHYEFNQEYDKGILKKDVSLYITNITRDFEIPFTDFTTSFQSGAILACLLSSLKPNLLSLHEELSQLKESATYSKELCLKILDLAQKNLEIPQYIDVETIVDNPDEKSIFLYVYQFYEKFKVSLKTPVIQKVVFEDKKEEMTPRNTILPQSPRGPSQIEELLSMTKLLQNSFTQVLKQNEDLKEIKEVLLSVNIQLTDQNEKLKRVEESLTYEIQLMREKHLEDVSLIKLQNEQIKLQNEQNSLSIQKIKEQNETIKMKNDEIFELEKRSQLRNEVPPVPSLNLNMNNIETVIDDESSHDTDDNIIEVELSIPRNIREMLRTGNGVSQFIKYSEEDELISNLIDVFKTTEYIQESLLQDPEYHNLYETLYHNLMNLNSKLNIDIFSKSLNTFDKIYFDIEKNLEEKFKTFIYSPVWNEILTKSKKDEIKKSMSFWKVDKVKDVNFQVLSFQDVIKDVNHLQTFKKFCEVENTGSDLEIYLLINTFRDKLIFILIKDLKLNLFIENLYKINLINFKRILNYNEVKLIFSIEEDIVLKLEKKFNEFLNNTKWDEIIKNETQENQNNTNQTVRRKLSSYFPKKVSKDNTIVNSFISPRKLPRKLTRFEELIEIIKKGDFENVKKFEIEENEFISSHPINGYTLLHEAVICSNFKITEFLIQKGIDVSSKDKSDRTPLHYACAAQNREICLLLLGNKAKVNIRDNSGVYPLLICLKRKNYEIANDLILFQADVNFKRENGCTLLHDMVINEDLQGLKWVLNQSNVKLNTKDLNGFTPLLRACSGKNPLILSELISRGADIEAKDTLGRNLFHIMILSKNIENLKLFLGMKLEDLKRFSKLPNEQIEPKKRTALHLAVESKNFKIVGTVVSIYVKLNLEMNIKDFNKQSPLDLSIEMSDKCTNLPNNNQIDIKDIENIVKIKQFLSKYFK